MSENKIYSFIGLARKAGAVAPGESAAINALRNGKAYIVILANDASENTQKRFTNYCNSKSVQLVPFGLKSSLGETLGKEVFSVMAITDKRFSDRIIELIRLNNQDNTAHGGGFFEQTENS